MRYGSQLDPPNRFESTRRERDLEHAWWDEDFRNEIDNRPIEFLEDQSESIVSKNNSPDLPFTYSLNPYRGCIHGCAYCYARPSHEYLGLNAGLDFETKIVVKKDAAVLLRNFLSRSSWTPEPIAFSGVTDCYQPAERQFQLTRQCLEVALECRQPISIVTKNALIARDLDLLGEMAKDQLVHVYLSVTTLEPKLAREMEPRTSIPAARLRTVEALAHAGVPVGAMLAPIIPGLNDSEIPSLLQAASNAGAQAAACMLLRLPLTVEPVFAEWLQRVRPEQAERVYGRIRQTRKGKLNDSQWSQRMTGTGEIADRIRDVFRIFRNKYGLDGGLPPHNCQAFHPPASPSGQRRLF